MTERIEEIKAKKLALFNPSWEDVEYLLAALEETQQQKNRLEVKLQASRDSVYPISVERDEYKVELAEAQQTIARIRENVKDVMVKHAYTSSRDTLFKLLNDALEGETQP